MDMAAMMQELSGSDSGIGEAFAAARRMAEADGAAAGEVLGRLEAKLDKLLAFDAILVEMIVPMLPRKVGAVLGPQLRAVLE